MPKRTKLKTFLLFCILLLILLPFVYFVSVEVGTAQTETAIEDSLAVDNGADRYIDNVAFGIGEKLEFDINYGFINAGTATMEVESLVDFNERPCYKVVTKANSNSFFSSFYKVEDVVESIIDADGIFSWHFEKHLREGSYSSDRIYSFDQENHSVVYKEDTIKIAPYVQDALSVLYYIRTQKLEVGKSVFVENFVDGKKYPMEIRVLKKENINVDAGNFDCIVVEPLMQSVGVFKHEGKLTVWLTDDRLKMPVLMKSKVLVGSISAELTKFKLGEIDSY